MTTQEGNKLIAEFMGLKKCTDKELSETQCYHVWDIGNMPLDDIEYHSDWSWIMPVVEKIGQMGHDVSMQIDDGQVWFCVFDTAKSEYDIIYETGGGKNLIDAIWLTVVQFIIWYNSQSKPTQP